MYRFILSIILLLTLSIVSSAQTCLPDGITFTTQSQIDSFPINYPECTEIGGSLVLTGSSISNLIGFSDIETIGGALVIRQCVSLINLEGLENITTLGALILDSNLVLQNVNSLSSLEVIQGNFDITSNYELIDFEGMESLYSISNNLYITDNYDLVNFNGLGQLIFIGGSLTIGDTDYYNLGTSNQSLTSLDGLNNLETINGSLKIKQNNELQSISALSSVTDIGGGITIIGNSFSSLDGLIGIDTIPYQFELKYTNINNFNGCNNIVYVGGSFEIERNDLLHDLSGLNNLTYVGYSMSIGDFYGNEKLNDISALFNLTFIGGELRVYRNDSLNSLNGLNNVEEVGSHLRIIGNETLTEITSLDNITNINGDLRIVYNSVLTSLIGLDNINPESITNIYIDDNPMLSMCNVYSICQNILNPNGSISISENIYGCNSISEVEVACIAAVEESNDILNFNIYPNPAQNEIYISGSYKIDQVSIYNQLGQLVLFKGEYVENIDVSDLINGIYLIEIKSNNSTFREKIIIE